MKGFQDVRIEKPTSIITNDVPECGIALEYRLNEAEYTRA
jgi:hypothetical protein